MSGDQVSGDRGKVRVMLLRPLLPVYPVLTRGFLQAGSSSAMAFLIFHSPAP